MKTNSSRTGISKHLPKLSLLIATMAMTSPLMAEKLEAPTDKTAEDIKTTFTEEELAKFQEERDKLDKHKMKAWWVQSICGIDVSPADGVVTWQEMETRALKWAGKKGHNRDASTWVDYFKAWDANGDGLIPITEFEPAYTEWWKARQAAKAENRAKKKAEEKAAKKAEGEAAEGDK